MEKGSSMAKPSVGNTAIGPATCRLIEQYEPERMRLFYDPVVKDLLSGPICTLLRLKSMRNLVIKQMDVLTPGLYGLHISRTRFIDDAVDQALSRGIGQVVILGAGLDTRPYRLSGIERTRVFEVDLPAVQEGKKKKLQKRFGRLPAHVTFIPIDFDKESLQDVFTGTPFDPASPAIFIWEGVTQYLTEEAVRHTLAFIGAAAPSSVLVFTYILKSVIERRSDIPDAEKMMDVVAKKSIPWLFGLEPSSVSSFLKPFHFDMIADVGNADYQARYLKPPGRKLLVSECERIVQAIVLHP
jgi:methyltransferase (TIGR00027 family)